ncbi:MAG TPA: GcrA family cell cycle regulator [Caulobacteraceae bacterium]|nr:GcrA family cell cycle regulator [Caulobacteraceae bacterium]
MANICPPLSPWTREREARAARLYLLEGFTAAEVADVLGGVTRAAVVGKMRRLGLLKRDRAPRSPATASAVPPPRREVRLPPQPPPIPLPPLREVGATGAPRRLADLADGACRWPVDDPGAGRMHLALFCAGPTDGGVYCAAHREIAVRVPPRPARAARR